MFPVSTAELNQHPTPFYAYNLTLLRQTLQAASSAAGKYGYHVHYALKANANAEIRFKIRHRVGFRFVIIHAQAAAYVQVLHFNFTP